MVDETKTNGGISAEELELYKKLQQKVKAAKEQGKELTNTIFEPLFASLDIEKTFSAIALHGGERISKTIKLEDGRKLNLCFRDMTNIGKDKDED
jgi:Icc-related predicted phosphoesterase